MSETSAEQKMDISANSESKETVVDEKPKENTVSETPKENAANEKSEENVTDDVKENTVNETPKENAVDEKSEKNAKDEAKEKTENGENVYAYLERDSSTTEKFKIEIRGLPKHYGIGEFRKFLNDKLQLKASKIKPPKRGSGWAYVCFRSEESRKKAITAINGVEWKRAKLTAQVKKIWHFCSFIIKLKTKLIIYNLCRLQNQHQILI